MWRTALPDWEKRILARQSLVPALPLYEAEAARALRIFKRLRLPDVADTPTLGEAGDDWIFDIVAAIFGAYDRKTRRRMVQEFFLLVPKKNAKSTYAAAIMVTAMIVNPVANAEFLLIAPTKEIADISFKQASGIIRLDAELTKLFHLQRHVRTIIHRNSGALLQIKAADTNVITGAKATGILVDETHVFANKADAADIFLEIRGGLAARPGGFMIQITTQSKDPPRGVFKSELALARDIRDGLVALPRLSVLYELPRGLSEDGGWKNEKYWPLVNPNLGRSVDEAFLRNALVAAEHKGIEELALFASQHFNVEIGVSLHGDRWAGADYWAGAADEDLTLDALIDRCDVAVVGIDGGGLDDLFGLAVLGRDRDTSEWLLWAHAWAHPDVLERRRELVSRLRDFEADGDLTICSDPTQDLREAADVVARLKAADLLPEKGAIGLDPLGVAALVDELAGRGLAEGQMVAVPQGYRLHGAVTGMERKLKDGTLWHGGRRLMAWCVGNAKVEMRGNATLITKQAAGRAKIDPLMAAFDAVVLMSRNPEAATAKQYQMYFAGGQANETSLFAARG
jgi:phage terminase large subunit-like protein